MLDSFQLSGNSYFQGSKGNTGLDLVVQDSQMEIENRKSEIETETSNAVEELSDVVIFTKSGRKLEPSLTNVNGHASPPWSQREFVGFLLV